MRLYVAAGIKYKSLSKNKLATTIARVPFCKPHSIVIALCCDWFAIKDLLK